jgi:hypothetical protein
MNDTKTNCWFPVSFIATENFLGFEKKKLHKAPQTTQSFTNCELL